MEQGIDFINLQSHPLTQARRIDLNLVQLLSQRPIHWALEVSAISEHHFKMTLNNLGPAVLGSTWGMFFLTSSMFTHKVSSYAERSALFPILTNCE